MIYEVRTYHIQPRSLPEVLKRFEEGYQKRKEFSELAAFWYTEIGPLNQIIHVWRFDDDADRRAWWSTVYSDAGFLEFAGQFRPLVLDQQNKLMFDAPWGPTP